MTTQLSSIDGQRYKMSEELSIKENEKSDLEEGAFIEGSIKGSIEDSIKGSIEGSIDGLSEDGTTQSSPAAPARTLHRVSATRALPGLVLHAFQIKKEGKVVPYDDAYVGLNEALAADNDVAGSLKSIEDTQTYWVDVDADERDRTELNEWIERLNLGNFISDQIKKPVEGTIHGS